MSGSSTLPGARTPFVHTTTGVSAAKGPISMTCLTRHFRTRTLLVALLGATALTATPALAQEAPEETPVSQNATVNLVNALVRKGILSRAEADTMIQQAEAEAARAQATAQAAQTAQTNAQTAVAAASPASAEPGTSVRYVPQFVRDQIKEEVKGEVLADAKREGLVSPDALPDWVRSIKISGDFRFRDEGRFFDKGNGYQFVDVASINSGAPYNTDPATNPNNPPIVNSQRNRNLLRIRARFGIEADVTDSLTTYFRIATGQQNNPDSTNQTLGGYYTNKSIWLDRAYVDYRPIDGLHIYAGRMANPFRLAELVWDDDVNLDGAALSYERSVGGGLSAFAVGGAFPLDFGADNAPAQAFAFNKQGIAQDKWLFAGQLGLSWQATSSVRASLDGAYYYYQNVEGALSPACSNLAAYCLTDYSRPGYSQKGNTLFAIRDEVSVNPTDTSSPQYFGLASKFHLLAISGDVDWEVADGLRLSLTGHYARNLGFNRNDVLARGFNPRSGLSQIVNNNESCAVALVSDVCPPGQSIFKSGNTAWLVRATFGTPAIDKRGDWQITGSYRRLEPDALLDAFTDQDFHLGGTNAKGWTIGGTYGLMRNTSFGVRWLSAQEISGPQFRVDVMQADFNVKF
ncbi:MAG: putative porin [Phycisphaerae bacterium]|nr:putative porin [Phycisphaerae bacterium]